MKPNPRTRVVNFRITQQEYEQMCSISGYAGFRCLSDFARAAVLEFGRSQQLTQAMVERLENKLSRALALLEEGREGCGRNR